MTTWITSGDRPSNSRLALQRAGPFRKVKANSQLRQRDWLINWGCSGIVNNLVNLLNQPRQVSLASNKLRSFEAFDENEVGSVPWSAQRLDAQAWLDDGRTVVARTVLTGHSGNGIIIVEPGDELPDAPLYTRYISKTHEYRIHVVRDQVIDVQRKIRDPEREPTTWKVRSHENGFMFVRNNVQIDDAIRELAVNAVQALGLDFGAVDIISDKHGASYILEINTAPGLEGQTITSYAEAFRNVCR